MNYPLTLRIQAFSLSAKIEVTDARGEPVCSVRKNRFKFREHVTVLASLPSSTVLGEIKAAPSEEFPSRYALTSSAGRHLGAFIRRSLPPSPADSRPALYSIQDECGLPFLDIVPQNPRTRSVDRALSTIPVLRLVSSCLFRPVFTVCAPGGIPRFLLRKRATPLENRYVLQAPPDSPPLSPDGETRLLLAVLMLVFLEG